MRSINDDTPDLEGLTENQIKFLTPLFEKNPSDRPSALEAHQSALGYIEFLLGRTKKPRPLKSRSRLKKVVTSRKNNSFFAFAFLGLLVFIFQSGIFSNEESRNLTTQCQTSLQNGNLDSAIEACTRAVAAGSESANFLLARAHLAKGSEDEAKSILDECKSQSLTCQSDFAYFFETGSQSLTSLKALDSEGDKDAAWRIGNYYQNQKDTATALSWYEKSSRANNPIANIYLAVYWGNEKKQFTKAIDYAKLAINGDLTGRPSLVTIDHPVERLIDSLYTSAGDTVGKIDFFTKCANEKVAFCVATVADTYLGSKDLVNAKKWGTIGAGLQDAKSMWVLAKVAANKNALLPKGTVDKAIDAEIISWYKKAAELGDVQSSFSLGFSYAMGIGSLPSDFKESCK
jgi:TPR repeat protein